MSDITQILNDIAQGDAQTDELFEVVYTQLRQLAQAQMHRESPGHTLQATALVHEAYLRLMQDPSCSWENRRHFFGAAAEAMRRILVERARSKGRIKRGGEHQRIDLPDFLLQHKQEREDDVCALHEALEAFEAIDPRKAELVKLRYFAGLGENEAALTLGISRATASRWWSYARAWLFDRIQTEPADE